MTATPIIIMDMATARAAKLEARVVTTLTANADSFSDKLCGNPLAWRLKAVSRPETKSPLVHYDRSRNVTVQSAPTITLVHSDRKCFGLNRPALRAGLRGTARIDQNHARTGTFSLVRCELDEQRPRGVVDGPSEHAALEASQIQIFESNISVPRNQRSRNRVRQMAALASNFSSTAGKARACLSPAVATFFAAGEGALSAALMSLRASGKPRGVNNFAIARGDQATEPKINANRAGATILRKLCLDAEHDVPLPSLPRDNRSAETRVSRQIAMPYNLDGSWYSNDTDAAVLLNSEAVTHPECCCVITRRSAEPREPVPSLEECGEGLVYPTQHLLQSGERPPTKPVRVRGTTRFQLPGLMPVSDSNAAAAVGFDPLLKTSVIKPAEISKHVAKRVSLGPRWPNAIFVRAHGHWSGACSTAAKIHAGKCKDAPRQAQESSRSSLAALSTEAE